MQQIATQRHGELVCNKQCKTYQNQSACARKYVTPMIDRQSKL